MNKLLAIASAATVALTVVISSAAGGPYGDCKQRALKQFGVGVLTQDWERMVQGVKTQGDCDRLLNPDNPKHQKIMEWNYHMRNLPSHAR